MAAADRGTIVVINTSSYRCDAFLVQHDQIEVLNLPRLSLKDVEQHNRDQNSRVPSLVTPTLEWLWDAAMEPILHALDLRQQPPNNQWPRIWWIPTGPLSSLPLHAAGYHNNGTVNTVLDRVMSSYSSSIRTLVHGRRQAVQKVGELQHALFVDMGQTPDCSHLPFATREVAMLAKLCSSLKFKSITSSGIKKDVLEHLRTCKIFHFAGHGKTDPSDPHKAACSYRIGERIY
jgi:CHAT domain-containing protein